jgi:hypothetical protein
MQIPQDKIIQFLDKVIRYLRAEGGTPARK